MPSNTDEIRRYNGNAMSEPERDAFEAKMVAEPDLARAVELEAVLQLGVREHGQFAGRAARSYRGALLGLAAVASVAAVCLWLGATQFAPDAYSRVQLVEFGQLRGVDDSSLEPRDLQAADDTLLVMDLPALASHAGAATVVVSSRADDRELFTVETGNAENGFVSIAIPRARIPDGEFLIYLRAGDRSGPQYPFRLGPPR